MNPWRIQFHWPPSPPPPSQEVPLPPAPRCGFQCTGKGGTTARCNRCSSMTLLRYVVSVYIYAYYTLLIFNPLMDFANVTVPYSTSFQNQYANVDHVLQGSISNTANLNSFV